MEHVKAKKLMVSAMVLVLFAFTAFAGVSGPQLVPDYDRDGTIDEVDCKRAAASETFTVRAAYGRWREPPSGRNATWFVAAFLKPEEWTNVVESAQAAARQIPVADIAALPTDGAKNVRVEGCVPGFYYTLYGAAGVCALSTTETTMCGPQLCGASDEVEFLEVKKPSDAAGFFSIGVSENKVVPLSRQ